MRRAAAALLFATTLLLAPSAGRAASPAPHWVAISQPAPTDFHPGDGGDIYEVIAVNDGAAPTSGPVTVSDTLPAGLSVNAANALVEGTEDELGVPDPFASACAQSSSEGAVTVTCTTPASVRAGRSVILSIDVAVPSGASGTLANAARISGGGAPDATATNSTPVTPASQPVPYGASFVSDLTDATGGAATQAGSHPFAFTTLLAFNVASVIPNLTCNLGRTPGCPALNAQTRDVEVALPAGLAGNPTAVPYCTQAQFEQNTFRGCPAATQVGSMFLYFYGNNQVQYAPVYDIEPPPGQPAELGFSVSTLAHVPIFFHVRSDGDYGLSADISNITQYAPVRLAALTVWGNPADSAHDPLRASQYGQCGEGCPSGVLSPRPFLRLPTSCPGGSLSLLVAGDSWQSPEAAPFAQLTSASIAGTSGCEALWFAPAIALDTSTRQAGAPAGYTVHLDLPQNEEVQALASPDLRDAEVSLPAGTALSPSAANGLAACSEAQFALRSRAPGACPAAARIGAVKVTTPLLHEPLSGSLYVGEPACSPCDPAQAQSGQLVRVLLEAEGSGVRVKLAGQTHIDQRTGGVTAVFTENPQQPVNGIEVALEGGPQAPLANPTACGPATLTARLTPWSTSTASEVTAPAIPIEGCAPQAFGPAFAAGATATAQAGAFTPFALTIARQDTEQDLSGIQVKTPPGLLGLLKGVERCGEPQAAQGACGPGSLIGHAAVTAGPGPSPLPVSGGQVFLTGPYHGAPFGLSISVPAIAGPFNLGTVITRAAVDVDPHTAQITVTSDPLPTVLDGVPLKLRTARVTIDRPGFMFNPTSCDQQQVTGTLTSAQGATAQVSSPFQAVNCASLPFKPAFSVSTQARTSKKNGASLDVKVGYPKGAQANIRSVAVTLPKQLPARLTTIQQACPQATFAANPASCPAGSVVGVGTASTPILAGSLQGPAFLVSHGGAAFPDLVVVLQGEGVTVDLLGSIDIKHGVTSSTFASIPDAPIGGFELKLPQGAHSGLTTALPAKARGSLCGQSLTMPTTITGQNGALIRQSTRIQVTGCAKAKKKAKAKKHRKKKK